ncbi:MAG: ATP-dependent DNA helicase RecG [Candidatus Neomarinimicrobiota bacterium]|nr:MAG: ATP-dependent DNA helicase RecG [Candidatus Neomarinimicrobiota bacterium]
MSEALQNSNTLDTPIQFIKGVGPKRAEVLHSLGISTIKDLLYYFPRKYVDRTSLSTIGSIQEGDEVNLVGRVKSVNLRRMKKGNFVTANVADHTGSIRLMWFNAADYIHQSLKVGDLLTMHGKVAAYKGSHQIVHPEYDKLNANEISLTTGFIIPVYPLTDDLKKSGLENRNLRKIIYLALQSVENIDDHFDTDLREQFDIQDLNTALRNIHYPKDFVSLEKSVHRLKYDEHFFLQLLLAKRKSKIKENKYDSIKFKTKSYNKILKNLHFELTGSQQLSLREIVDDFLSENPMNRMIQGDVGCGKTIVSILASAIVVDNNYQVAIMAPTDLLSKQLFKNFKSQFESIGVECTLLVGSLKPKEKNKVLGEIKSGKSNIIIGTHALFQKDVIFNNLGFVVIDEQHRFGVNQRQKLLSKSNNPNLMAMTATPIPRTLAITYNGDMDLSIIDELPKNRPDIHTSFIEKENLSTAFNFIREKVEDGGQTIIVYPLINESEKQDLSAAVESYEYLRDNIFPDLTVGLMHGKLEDENKNLEMKNFMKGEIDILVSTTVVEVGIDNPNVNVMLINNSERFGLSQLHQLRGRVGRGTMESYCLLCSDSESPKTKERLSIIVNSRNGFEIADEDLKLRGPGEFFGEKQSGFVKFKIADLITDGPIIRDARMKAFEIIKNDANLSQENHSFIKQKFDNEYLKLFLKTTVN